jgi:uncharacterized protein (TIGR02391 family)
MNDKYEARVERTTLLFEAKPGSYKSIRISRIKYKDNDEPMIDIRQYQRGYDEEGEEAYFPTKVGFQIAEREYRKSVEAYILTPRQFVHPSIASKTFAQLAEGDFDGAVLKAFRTVEVQIRKKSGAPAESVGVDLARRAFNPDHGPLTDPKLPKAEREALCHFVAGAIGYYKNPCSHRDVEMDFLEAFHRIVVASELLRIVEKSGRVSK